MNTSLFRGALFTKSLLLAAGSLLFGCLQASASLLDAGVDLGAAGLGPQWGIFILGNGNGPNEIGGSSSVFGNVGVGGFDQIDIRGHSTIEGDLVVRRASAYSLSKNAHINGNIAFDPSSIDQLRQGVADAKSAAQAAFSLERTLGFPKTIDTNKDLTLTGSGTVVLKLDDFRLAGHAALTLAGDIDTTFIINVKETFTMGGNSRVQLSGGLTWDNVLFNIRGDGDAFLGGNAQLDGIILAKKRSVELRGNSQVNGEIIAGAVKMVGASTVTRVPVVSP